MHRVADRVRGVMQTVLVNHSHHVTGTTPSKLNTIFRTYIFPLFLYGSPLWIFQLRERFRYDEPLVYGYGESWLRLRALYRRCTRSILGVNPSTSGEAVLVRMGWLPLDYLLALHGLRWYIRCSHGLCGVEVKDSAEFEEDQRLTGYQFFDRAANFLITWVR